MEDAVSALSQETDFNKVVVFNEDGNILHSTYEVDVSGDLKPLTTIFLDNDKAFENGIAINGVRFDVHRFYEDMIYGRTEELAPNGKGVALYKQKTKSGRVVIVLVEFVFPVLTTKAVPALKKFCNLNIAHLTI
eukprot:TRINITY_DN160_c0_g1_i2.p1 TRINITY_DN160_c0_g1~~TRINITY_DN160_c0_g1_i2.p1  ORF type:complete len:134 (-),score=22.65 TRINITY_DN160_c0_g1_i2:94-495(-)